jgi:hypothetical protein
MAGLDDYNILQPEHLVGIDWEGRMTRSAFKTSDRTVSHAGVVWP